MFLFTDNMDWVKETRAHLDFISVNWNEVSGKRNFRDIDVMCQT